MSKAYIIYDCKNANDEKVIAAAPNLRDVLAVGSRIMEEAISKNTRRPEFRVMSCQTDGGQATFLPIPVDIQIGAKIVHNGDAA